MLRIIIKLVLCYLGLIVILSLLYWLVTLISIDEYNFLGNYALSVVEDIIPALIGCIYSWTVLKILKYNSKKQIIMIINSISLTIFSIAIIAALYFLTKWLNITIYLVFLRALIIVGVIAVTWSFTCKHLYECNMVKKQE